MEAFFIVFLSQVQIKKRRIKMPLIIPRDLIVEEVLERENIFTMRDSSAIKQDIRPLSIAIVNLMPKKEETELQLLRMLSNTALQINIDLVRM